MSVTWAKLLPVPESTSPLRIFVSNAPEDQALAGRLVKHLRVLERHGKIDLWSSDRVRAGTAWREEILRELERAHVALLLLSSDYLSSDFIEDEEFTTLLARRASEGLIVIPIRLRTCLWEEEPRVGSLRALPPSGHAIAAYAGDAQDQVMTEVAREILRIAQDRQAEPAAALQLQVQGFFAQLRRYLNKHKIAEAKNTLGAITRAIAASMERVDQHGGHPDRLPPSAPLTPSRVPQGAKVALDAHTWDHPTWKLIKFSMTEPVYFSYAIDTTPDGRTAVARAVGDLNGEGKVLVFEKTVTLDTAGNAVISPEIVADEVFVG